eukprot:72886_1
MSSLMDSTYLLHIAGGFVLVLAVAVIWKCFLGKSDSSKHHDVKHADDVELSNMEGGRGSIVKEPVVAPDHLVTTVKDSATQAPVIQETVTHKPVSLAGETVSHDEEHAPAAQNLSTIDEANAPAAPVIKSGDHHDIHASVTH